MPDDENVRHMWSDRKLDEVLEVLHADVPATSEARARVRAKLMLAATAGTVAVSETPQPETTTKRRALPLAAAAAAVAVVAAGAVVIVNAASQGSAPATIPSAPPSTTVSRPPATTGSQHAPMPSIPAQPVNSLGDLASRMTDSPLAPGQYRYVAGHMWIRITDHGRDNKTPFVYLAEAHTETWIPADQRQTWMARNQTTGNRKWIVGTEEQARAGGVRLETAVVMPKGETRARCGDFMPRNAANPCEGNPPGTVDTSQGPQQPPSDPRALYEWLANDSASYADPPLQFFRTATGILDARYSADQRRATLRALSYHPYLTVMDAHVSDGRPAISVSIDFAGGHLREQVLLDPVTAQVIGTRMSVLKDGDGAKAGEVINDEVRRHGVVGKLGEKPVG